MASAGAAPARPVDDMRELLLTEHEAGQRLDRLLRKLRPDVPLGALFRWLRSGVVRVDGRKADGALRLAAGMRLSLPDDGAQPAAAPPPHGFRPREAAPPGAMAPRIVHQDDALLVLDKPSGLAVHGGTGVAASVVGWLDAAGLGVRTATFRPAPAHRLDRGTAGLLLVGLTPAAQRALTAAFRDERVAKTYHAVVLGRPQPPRGVVDAPLRLVAGGSARTAKVVVDRAGEAASTAYETLATRGGRSLLRLEPRQGRQHQLRAHLAHLGCPIVGDRRYGAPAGDDRNFLLHCTAMTLPHPRDGAPFACRVPLPPRFRVEETAGGERA